METKDFELGVKRLKRLHTIGIISLLIAAVAFLFAPTSTLWAETGTPYLLKSLLTLICIADIPLLYWQYDKNVKQKEQSEEERKENLLKWGYVRMVFWMINVLLCLLMYHFDSDALKNRICPTFYLTILCFLVFAVLARVNENDGADKTKK